MMLRSSSTPVLGSLLATFSDSPNCHHQPELHGKLLCTNGVSQNLSKSLFHSPDIRGTSASLRNGFRRAQSEGNLEELAEASYGVGVDEFSLSKKFARKSNCFTLEAIPSFSVTRLGSTFTDDDSDDEEEIEEEDDKKQYRVQNLVSIQERTNGKVNGGLGLEDEGKMYLATGLGVSRIRYVDAGWNGGSGGGRGGPVDFDRDGGDSGGLSMEEHYRRMLEGDPGNPLVLRNYAQFLYQKKGDLKGAEEYYSRAILADPKDGEILSQYATLIWQLHQDKERAATYFQRAIQASSEDSHIHAAYASFLWDTEDDEDEDQENAAESSRAEQPLFHHGLMASATA